MIDDLFASRVCDWLSVGASDGDVIVSTRVRLARNLRGFAMPWRLASERRIELEDLLDERIGQADLELPLKHERLDRLADRPRHLLVERNLISREHAEAEGRRGVYYSRDERLSVMTNEEDHLRLQAIRPGLDIQGTWSFLNGIDSRLERVLPFAVSDELGYLTACPTNVGTGLRVSVMMHLPTLARSGQIEKVSNAANRIGLVLRGLRGEGSEATGDFYQVSNQVTLGRSEQDILDDLQAMVVKIVEWERGLRALLLRQSRVDIEDRVWRAWGTLRFARKISSDETLKHLSAVRLGVNLELLQMLHLGLVNELFLMTQPAHLQTLLGRDLDPEERDRERARFIRERLRRIG